MEVDLEARRGVSLSTKRMYARRQRERAWTKSLHLFYEDQDDEMVNDAFGTIDPADTMETDPDEDPEAGGKGISEKVAE